MIPLALLCLTILLAALGAVWMARPVHAALTLALTLALVGVLYVSRGAHFLGLVQFAVYVGAVAVLIVFSLLITRPGDEDEEIKRRPRALLTGISCVLPVAGVLTYNGIVSSHLVKWPWQPSLSLKELGELLFTSHAPAVLALGVLLTAVMIGAALFARESASSPKDPPGK